MVSVLTELVLMESVLIIGCLGGTAKGSFRQKRKISQKLSSFLRQMKPTTYSLV